MAQSASQPVKVTEIYGKMAAYLESKGFAVTVPPTAQYPASLEGIIEEADKQGLLRERVVKKSYRRIYSVMDYLDARDASKFRIIKNPKPGTVWHDYLVAGEYKKNDRVSIRIIQFQDRELLVKHHLKEYAGAHSSLSQKAHSEGLQLNVRQSPDYAAILRKQREERAKVADGWWSIPDFRQGTKALIAAQAEQDYALWGESTLNEVQYDQSGALLDGDSMATYERLEMRVLSDTLAMDVYVSCSEQGSDALKDRVSRELPALGIMGDLYTQLTGKPFPYQLGQQQPDATLSITSSADQLTADGRSKATLLLTVTHQKGPVAGLPIVLKIPPYLEQVWGKLSATQVVTDKSGMAQVQYTSPAADDLGDTSDGRVEIQADCEALGLRDTLYLDLVTQQPVHITTKHAILPAHPDYPNELTFTFNTPDKAWGKEFKTILSCSSESGRLRVGTRQTGRRELTVTGAVSGSENTVFYRWTGPQPDAAVDEIVTIDIPDLKLTGEVAFSVGIDLTLDAVPLAWTGPFYPGLTLPIKATIKDRFHPEADLAEVLADFEIKPTITIEQKSFSPVAIGSVRDDQFVQNFVKGVTGAIIPHGSLTHGVYAGTVKQTPEGWLLTDATDKGVAGLARVTCHDMGSYLFTVTLEPDFKGDATDTLHEAAVQVSIEQIPPDEEQLFTFLVPTMQAYLALYPGASELSDLVEISAMAHEGRLKEALLNMGKEFLMDSLKETATEYAKKTLGSPGRTFMKALEKRVSKESFARMQKVLDKTSDTLNNDDVADVMELLNLDVDIVGHVVAASVDAGATEVEDKLKSLQTFLKGADTCGAVIVVHNRQAKVNASDASGQPWQRASGQLFENSRNQRLYQGEHTTVIPFVQGETFTLDLQGQGDQPVRIYKVLGDGTHAGILDYQGQAWKKTLTIDGSTVQPQ